MYSEFPRFLEECKRGLRPSVSAKIDENIKNIKIKVSSYHHTRSSLPTIMLLLLVVLYVYSVLL